MSICLGICSFCRVCSLVLFCVQRCRFFTKYCSNADNIMDGLSYILTQHFLSGIYTLQYALYFIFYPVLSSTLGILLISSYNPSTPCSLHSVLYLSSTLGILLIFSYNLYYIHTTMPCTLQYSTFCPFYLWGLFLEVIYLSLLLGDDCMRLFLT